MLPDVIIDLIEDYLLAMSGAGECPKPKVIRRLINKSNRAFARILGVEYPTALHHHYVNNEILHLVHSVSASAVHDRTLVPRPFEHPSRFNNTG